MCSVSGRLHELEDCFEVTGKHKSHGLNSDALIQEHWLFFSRVIEMKVTYSYSFLKLRQEADMTWKPEYLMSLSSSFWKNVSNFHKYISDSFY